MADAMLGNVARDLRLLGYDAVYVGYGSDSQILGLCQAQGRILVTRDRALASRARPVPCVLVSETEPRGQAVEVLRRLGLRPSADDPLTRCLECNTPLEELHAAEAWARVPDHVALTQDTFRACPGCDRVYWSGGHAGPLEERIHRMLQSLHPQGGQV